MEGSVEALDERKAAILRAIVEQYVASAVPVGSATVTRTADLSRRIAARGSG
jgi:transcriptional regulator of heat shock response